MIKNTSNIECILYGVDETECIYSIFVGRNDYLSMHAFNRPGFTVFIVSPSCLSDIPLLLCSDVFILFSLFICHAFSAFVEFYCRLIFTVETVRFACRFSQCLNLANHFTPLMKGIKGFTYYYMYFGNDDTQYDLFPEVCVK